METIAIFHSPLTSKFGIPRQSGLVEGLEGEIVFESEYRNPDYVRGLEGFDYIWLLWAFSANKKEGRSATVRPPLLGGNQSVGVFATRSPYRPNPIGLSSVRIERIDFEEVRGPVIRVSGADLMDGTPIYDIKPYVEYSDCHMGVKSGFVDEREWKSLDVSFAEGVGECLPAADREVVAQLLSLDPRPHFHNDPERVYGMPFGKVDVRFRVEGDRLIVVEIVESF